MTAGEEDYRIDLGPRGNAEFGVEVRGILYRTARDATERARLALHQAIREAVEAGVSESECARLGGVTRMTVRHALGK